MNILTANTAVQRKLRRVATLVCLLSACVATSANAAPDDALASLRGVESNAVEQPAGSMFGYLSIAGSAFHPLDNTTSYSYPGAGCIAKTGGMDARFVHRVILPDGAVARYLRLYYYDTSTANVFGFFTTYDGAGNYVERTNISSASGAPGYDSVLSSDLAYTVDRYTSAINILVNLGIQNDETLQLCGVRIAYDSPITDRIFASGFDSIPR